MSELWWLAVNKNSVAASLMALPRSFEVRPTPEQLFGFHTQAEQLAVQRFLLSATIEDATMFMKGQLSEKVRSGEVAYIRPDSPEPPTKESTAWIVKEPGQI